MITTKAAAGRGDHTAGSKRRNCIRRGNRAGAGWRVEKVSCTPTADFAMMQGSCRFGRAPAELREEQLFERDLQTVSYEGNEDRRFDALLAAAGTWALPAKGEGKIHSLLG